MKTELSTIVMDGMDVVECIRREALNKNTVKRPLEDITQIEWQNTVELYILGDDTARLADGGLEAGCYLDSDASAQVIVLGASNERITRIINRCGGRLRTLDLRFLNMESLELPTRFDQLEHLRLSPMERLREVIGLTSLRGLTGLDLSFTDIGSVFDVTKLPLLRRLELAGNMTLNRVDGLNRLSNLEELDLSGTAVGEELDLSSLRKLKRLRLVDADQLKRVFGLGENPDLEYLDLSCSGLITIPDDVRKLKKLIHMDMSNLSLEDLPDWIPELKLDFTFCNDGINLRGTNVIGTDMQLFNEKVDDQGFGDYQKRIQIWFEDRKNAVAKPLNEVKVVFLGDGGAGKSHIIARLLQNGEQTTDFPNISTPGITVQDKTYDIGDRSMNVHYWDFGGQEILHSMHRMFLTKRTLYVVVVNVRDGNQDERARYWLHNLKSFADGAPVLLVLNQMDMNKNASINEEDLRKLYPGLTEVVKLSALTYSDEEFRKRFVNILLGHIAEMDILDMPLIAAGRRVKDILQNMPDSYIHGDVFRRICDECGVTGTDAVRRDLLDYYSELGISFCYSDSMELEDHVVLRPDWITNAIYVILFNKVETVNSGLVSHEMIYRMLSSEDAQSIRRTVAAAKYERVEVDYVLKVFRKFRLSFLVEDGVEFLPMLCDANSTAAAVEYENAEDALEFRLYYEYLPNNAIHRLMVDRRKEMDRTNVWLTGARFVCGDTGRSAVVKSEGNLIRILVRADKEPRNPQRYLDELKESLERINEIMGLTVSNMEVVYKEDGKTACFDYADLMFAQEVGETHIPCREFRKRIRLADVLMQSDFPEDEKQKKLMADIRYACEILQSNSFFRNSNEDVRTTHIRDLLMARDYIVIDQHRSGISAGGLQSGEVDLDIRLTSGDAWSALEALNLKGSSDSQIEYWNAHLKKLLNNYNDVGRSFLFFVSYVQCPKEKFSEICSDLFEHMRFYSPPGFELLQRFVQEIPLGSHEEQSRFIRIFKCVYDCGGVTMTVYHYFVRIGE